MIRNICLFVCMVFLNACFIEDVPIPPHEPGEESVFDLKLSIYDYMIWFDFSSEAVVKVEGPDYYHLGFETGADSYHIRLNTASNFKICPTGESDFQVVTSIPQNADWLYDASTGDLDSTAIGEWVQLNGNEKQYSNQVYLLGQFTGLNYQVYYKIQFLFVDEEQYRFRAAAIDGSNEEEFAVLKDSLYRFVYFSFETGGIVEQPHPKDWDILFTPYLTTLYTNEGVPTPYNVRGIFLNEAYTAAVLDTISNFVDITYETIENYLITNQLDIIGHEWKHYNGEDYVVRPWMNFILHDTEGYWFKFRFIRYHNSENEKGFPSIEYQRL